jgi:hypothetical protein
VESGDKSLSRMASDGSKPLSTWYGVVWVADLHQASWWTTYTQCGDDRLLPHLVGVSMAPGRCGRSPAAVVRMIWTCGGPETGTTTSFSVDRRRETLNN